MKLQFDPNQQYQLDAIKSTVDVFEGQPLSGGDFEFTLLHTQSGLRLPSTGVANNLLIDAQTMLNNVNVVKERNGVPLEKDGTSLGVVEIGAGVFPQFTIEMETATGKTYVYLRTVYELNKQYGFKKFIIVVPSIAIREGVLKNLEITKDHFASLYNNVPVDYFVYDSRKLGKLRGFATGNTLQIMVINIDAFNKDINIMHQDVDRLQGKPIDFIRQTSPIVVMDEPQNMESDTAKKAIASLNPLCTFRYSATHRNYYNLLYKLDPVQAYDLGLVKKIEVDSVLSDSDANNAFVQLVSIDSKKKGITAKIKIHVNEKDGASSKQVTIKPGSDLFELSKEREVYKSGFTVEGIDAENGYIEFSNGVVIKNGETRGGLSDEIMKEQIRETIREHFEKELKLTAKGIKVLSLFFIDRVANYRAYSGNEQQKGKIAQWFEEIYSEMAKLEKYKELNLAEAGLVHNGYFSIDNKGHVKDTNGQTQADDDTYALIMKDKERLLSFREPLRFIFSHSALREGWDSPNVFQICTLNETKSELKKRQEIGRGLRLAVNQDGERIFDTTINRLTVIANESYEEFANKLQTEIHDECGVDFTGRIKNKKKSKVVKVKKGYQLDENFKALWDKIKQKTKYQVEFKTDELIAKSAKAVKEMSRIESIKIKVSKARIEMKQEGIFATPPSREKDIEFVINDLFIPDVLHYIQTKVELTRDTIYKIILKSDRLDDILVNPQQFVDQVSEIIRFTLQQMMVDGIKYEKIAGQEYKMTLFESEELMVYLSDKNTYEVKDKAKTVYDYYELDSEVESDFIKALEEREDILFYVKLPRWFTIGTPIGTYNPDWAIVFEGDKKLYFVAETKGTNKVEQLKLSEQLKIRCGEKHFAEFEGVEFKAPVVGLQDVLK